MRAGTVPLAFGYGISAPDRAPPPNAGDPWILADPAPTDRDTLIANERTKLSATYVNGVAIAVLAVGGLAPLFAQRATLPIAIDPWLTPAISLLCLCISGALHWAARGSLRELR